MFDREKAEELRRAKLRALLLLVLMGALFALTAAWHDMPHRAAFKAVSEAALVGGLADWFAVHALFYRIPTPFPFISNHTAIIPRNKDRIAENLAAFVKDKFLSSTSMVELIQKHDPAERLGRWLRDPDNGRKLGGFMIKAFAGAVGFVEEAKVQQLMRDALKTAVQGVDLSKSTASVLETMRRGGRHQELLEHTIEQLVKVLEKPETSRFLASKIVEWLKREHTYKEKVLPSEWIGANGASLVANGVTRILEEIMRDRGHQLRVVFDEKVNDLMIRLKADPEFMAAGERIKEYLLNDPAVTGYLSGLWEDIRTWVLKDVHSPNSVLRRNVEASGRWLGEKIAEDEDLRTSLNSQLKSAAESMAPDFADFLTGHIRDTVKRWDPNLMAAQIELNVGRDLQAIRINGTVVGGIIGLCLYAIPEAGRILTR